VTLDLILVGFGNVGRRLVRLLDERRTVLTRTHGVETRVVAIGTRRLGGIVSPSGLDAITLANQADNGAALGLPFTSTRTFLRGAVDRLSASARDRRLVVVETTTLDVVNGRPAIDHVRLALAGGAHVVTANKGPAAFAYASLSALARRVDRLFLFESSVMDGVPIFNLQRTTLPAATILGFDGVINTTTNFILTAMECGEAFDAALAAMQRAGIAEADASLDLDGWDAAAKTAALANALMGARITPHDVKREAVTAAAGSRARHALAAGRRLKLVASASRAGKTIDARVTLSERDDSDVLARVDGRQNAIVLHTDVLDDIVIVQRGSSLTHTAYGLVSDLVSVARAVDCSPARHRSPRRARRDRTRLARGRR